MVGLKDALSPLVTDALQQLGGVDHIGEKQGDGRAQGTLRLGIEACALYAPPARTSKDERGSETSLTKTFTTETQRHGGDYSDGFSVPLCLCGERISDPLAASPNRRQAAVFEDPAICRDDRRTQRAGGGDDDLIRRITVEDADSSVLSTRQRKEVAYLVWLRFKREHARRCVCQ